MNVLVVEPGIAPYEKEINGLPEMQNTVGGLINAIYPFEDLVAVISNDESILLGKEFNRSMPGGYGGIFGTFFVCGLDNEGERYCSLTSEQMGRFKKYFHKAEILIGARGNEPVTIKVEPNRAPSATVPDKKPSTPER